MKRSRPTVDLGYPTAPCGRIPTPTDVAAEAAFWDTHGFTDFEDEATPVAITVGSDLVERTTPNAAP